MANRKSRRRDRHFRRVAQALDAALSRHDRGQAPTMDFDPGAGGLVIFSDQHKGARDGADDFRRAERAYNAALAYYFETGHTLVELGDVEELWEENPTTVIDRYARTFSLTRRFQEAGRYWRIFGNHDDLWSFPDAVKRHLAPALGDGLEVHESVVLRLTASAGGPSEDGPTANEPTVDRPGGRQFRILLLHGHQGSILSDRYTLFSRVLVRILWRPLQRLTGWSPNTPARSWDLRNAHNQALHRWAAAQVGLLLVAGHTHEPVFVGGSRAEQLQRAIDETPPEEQENLARLKAELEWVLAERSEDDGALDHDADVPASNAYFNTGCCCYRDGDITGLEIADGQIRLVRWPDDADAPRPKVLASAELDVVLAGL